MALVFKTVGPWGAGQGANLAPGQVDNNFWELLVRLADLEHSPLQPVSIDDFIQSGSQFTVVLTDATTRGPFTIPTVNWTFVNEWQPFHFYLQNNVLTYGGSVYLVLHNHLSAATFDEAAFDVDGQIYGKMISIPNPPYDMGLYHAGRIFSNSAVLCQVIAARPLVVPVNFLDSRAFLRIPVSTEDVVLPILHNEAVIGTVSFFIGENELSGGSGQFGTLEMLSPAAEVQLVAGDRIEIQAPDISVPEDGTAERLSVTLVLRGGFIT